MEPAFSEETVQRILAEQREALKREMTAFLQRERRMRWIRHPLTLALLAGGVGLGIYYVLDRERREVLQRQVRKFAHEFAEEIAAQEVPSAEASDAIGRSDYLEHVLKWALLGLLTRRLLQWLHERPADGTP